MSRPGVTKAWLRQTSTGLAWSVPARALGDFVAVTPRPTAEQLLGFCERDARGVRDGFEALISVDAPLLSLGRYLVRHGWRDQHAACGGAGCYECGGTGAIERPAIDWEEAV